MSKSGSNVNPDLWAEGLATYIKDKHCIDAARGIMQRHAKHYEDRGISWQEIKRRHKESQMTESERQELYAEELVSRRALDMMSASSPEDFDALMTRAALTEAAAGDGAQKLAEANAYNDGFNSARHGGAAVVDNPHFVGSMMFVEWARGCEDGIDYNATLATAPARQALPGTPVQAERVENVQVRPIPAGTSGRGRKRKNAAEPAAAIEPGEEFTGFDALPDIPADALPN